MWVLGRSFSLIHGLGWESKGELLFSIRQSWMSELNRIKRVPFSHRRAVMLCVTSICCNAEEQSNQIPLCMEAAGEKLWKALLCLDPMMTWSKCINLHLSVSARAFVVYMVKCNQNLIQCYSNSQTLLWYSMIGQEQGQKVRSWPWLTTNLGLFFLHLSEWQPDGQTSLFPSEQHTHTHTQTCVCVCVCVCVCSTSWHYQH